MAPKLLGVSIEKSPVIYESLPRTLDALPEAKTGSVVSPNMLALGCRREWSQTERLLGPQVLSLCGIGLLLSLNIAKRRAKEAAAESRRQQALAAAEDYRAGAVAKCSRAMDVVFTFLSPVMILVAAAMVAGAAMCGFEHADAAAAVGGVGGGSGSGGSGAGELQEEVQAAAQCADVKMVGELPFGWPTVAWPSKYFGVELFGEAAQVSMVILAEHVSNVKLYSSIHSYSVDHNAELMSIGLTNFAGSMLSSFAVGARFTGSAVNNSVGATSQVSLFVSGVAALAVMPVLAPLLYYLPKPTLSIVVVFAVAGVVDLRAW